MQLVTYANRLVGDLIELKSVLDDEFKGLFDGVHVLPFYYPIDGEDAGFDPIDHLAVDSKVGAWQAVSALAGGYRMMADIIVNHMSAGSKQFLDVLEKGESSDFWPLFLKKTDLFQSKKELKLIDEVYRVRPGNLFTPIALNNGEVHEFWTSFSANQLDINVEHETGRNYLHSILGKLSENGVREIRLDAAGYAIKRAGTSCFMLPETFEFIAELSEQAANHGIDTLVEIHSHFQTQIQIAERVGKVYDFALPPLVLHTLYNHNAAALKHWLSISPRNCITVLDTHDGIGIVDAARDGEKPGLLDDAQIDNLVEAIHAKTRGESRRASGHSASNLDVYQVNATFYDALGQIDNDYLIARAIQFFAPGEPQIYYVGLLAGKNDMDLVERTNVGRDINRHYYTRAEIADELRRPVVQELANLIRLRNSSLAFAGEFSLLPCADTELSMHWSNGGATASLFVDFPAGLATITLTNEVSEEVYQLSNGKLEVSRAQADDIQGAI